MLRLLFKLIVLLVLAALIYGLWLGYRERSPEGKQEFNRKIADSFQGVSRLLGDAGCWIGHEQQTDNCEDPPGTYWLQHDSDPVKKPIPHCNGQDLYRDPYHDPAARVSSFPLE